MAELSSHTRFPRYIQFRAPEKLPDVIAVAANKKLTTASEYVRRAVIKELEADGHDIREFPTQLNRIEAKLELLTPKTSDAVVQRQVIEMLSYMATGKKIEAIKECRAVARVSLKQAKDLICAAMKE